jgi:hypothetical protein
MLEGWAAGEAVCSQGSHPGAAEGREIPPSSLSDVTSSNLLNPNGWRHWLRSWIRISLLLRSMNEKWLRPFFFSSPEDLKSDGLLDHLITACDEGLVAKASLDTGREKIETAVKLINGDMAYLKRAAASAK